MNQGPIYCSHIEQICLKVISLFYVRTALHMLAWTYFTQWKYKCRLFSRLSCIIYVQQSFFFSIQLVMFIAFIDTQSLVH